MAYLDVKTDQIICAPKYMGNINDVVWMSAPNDQNELQILQTYLNRVYSLE
jgi:hypothetical protein